MSKIKIALIQHNVIVGDITGNLEKAVEAQKSASQQDVDLIVLSELFLSGYPPEDLVHHQSFLDDISASVETLAATTQKGAACLVGVPWRVEGKTYNAALLLENGRIASTICKSHLPNHTVFDEMRVFSAGQLPKSIPFRGAHLGVRICEDIWVDPPEIIEDTDIIIVMNSSPFEIGKMEERLHHARSHARAHDAPLIYVNQLGGQDELVFDGASFVMNAAGDVCVQLPAWEEAERITILEKIDGGGWQCQTQFMAVVEEDCEAIWQAMILGTKDYVEKNNFPSVVLGLSGGVDSALVAAIACDAVGAARVHCLLLPSRFTSDASREDADACASLLGVSVETLSIANLMEETQNVLAPLFAGRANDLTEENIQSRLRGLLLMALSNKFGHLLLSTGNKSEISVGYTTLYGDMNGGFNPIKDIYKTQLYEIAKWRNAHFPKNMLGRKGTIVPQSILDKAPSAELRENQKDEDSLPPYDVLDDILRQIIDEDLSLAEIAKSGHAPELVKQIAQLVRLAEYKRRQAPPGVRIGKRSFGRGRRYPITNHYGSR